MQTLKPVSSSSKKMSQATGWLQNWTWCLLSGQTVPLYIRLLLDTEALTPSEERVLEFLRGLPERGSLRVVTATVLWAFVGHEAALADHLDRAGLSPLARSRLVLRVVGDFPVETLKVLSRQTSIYMGLAAAVSSLDLSALEYIVSRWSQDQEPVLTAEEEAQEVPFLSKAEILMVAVVTALESDQPDFLRPLMPLWNLSHLTQPIDSRLARMLRPSTAQVLLEYNSDLAYKFLLRNTAYLSEDTRAYLLANLRLPSYPLFLLNHLTRGHLATGAEVLERLPLGTPPASPSLDQERLERLIAQVYNNMSLFVDHLQQTSRPDLLAKLEVLIRQYVVPRMIERLAQGLPADA